MISGQGMRWGVYTPTTSRRRSIEVSPCSHQKKGLSVFPERIQPFVGTHSPIPTPTIRRTGVLIGSPGNYSLRPLWVTTEVICPVSLVGSTHFWHRWFPSWNEFKTRSLFIPTNPCWKPIVVRDWGYSVPGETYTEKYFTFWPLSSRDSTQGHLSWGLRWCGDYPRAPCDLNKTTVSSQKEWVVLKSASM